MNEALPAQSTRVAGPPAKTADKHLTPTPPRSSLTHDLVLPAVLFMALGAMTWAVRGSSGFGAVNGCVFAGVTWGAAWWFISREPGRQQARPYASGWIILALTVGIGISGDRGWMQWPSFFENHLQLNTPQGKFVPISRLYGFVWLFIAGVPWAGLGACLLAWCGSHQLLRRRDWVLRLSCGLGMALLARALFQYFPEIFLPLYKSLKTQYADPVANPNLRRLIGDNRAALTHLGLYCGFLLYEVVRKNCRNVALIATVGVVNGIGWALCQNWRWAAPLWPQAHFNWWRCWESCGGISIGAAYGLAFYIVNRPCGIQNPKTIRAGIHPNLERFGAYCGLLLGLGLSVKNGLKGWANIYVGHEEYWNHILWLFLGPALLLGLAGLILMIRLHPIPSDYDGDLFPHRYRLIWLVLITQNVIAQLVTGPYTVWNEMAFKIYYVLLLLISGSIVHHSYCLKRSSLPQANG